MKSSPAKPNEKGGFVLGLIVGLLLGLGVALGVALYVAKVPIPFVDKVPQRSADEDAKEAAANKDWNPNANLPGSGKLPPARPAASGVVAAPAAAAASAATDAATAAPAAPRPLASTPAAPVTPPAVASAPRATDGAYVFFVQAGAFTTAADAEQQRARLAMQGFNAKVYERASGDRTVFRVRIGPFDERGGADELLTQVQAAGLEAAVVRTQR